MMAEAGLAALWLAAAMALLQLVGGMTLLRGGAGQLVPLIKPAAYVQGALCAFAFLALMWLFYVTDLSVLLVASNSHIDKPLIFKLAGTWGNHEGSMLLWVSVLSVSGAAIALLDLAALWRARGGGGGRRAHRGPSFGAAGVRSCARVLLA